MTIDGTIKLGGKYEYIKSNPVSNVYMGRTYSITIATLKMVIIIWLIHRDHLVGKEKVMIKTIKGERGRKSGQ
jgi:hypothetical protein